MTMWKKVIVGSLLIIAAAAGGGWWLQDRPAAEQFGETRVTRGDLEITILSTGTVQPRNRLEIKPPLSGRAEEVLVNEGARVRKGQILAWMSSTERAALLDAARAKGPEEVRRWEEFYRATPIIAPIDGTVIGRMVEPGQTFTNNDAVLVIADRLIVEAQVDETDIARVRNRQDAQIILDAYPDVPVPARVSAIAYEAKIVNNVTTYTVDVEPRQVPPFMRSGMTANVSFVVARKTDALLLPAYAVHSRDGDSYVLVRAADGRPVERPVETGMTDGKHVEVVSGVQEGDPVLVARLQTRDQRPGGTNPFTGFGRRR